MVYCSNSVIPDRVCFRASTIQLNGYTRYKVGHDMLFGSFIHCLSRSVHPKFYPPHRIVHPQSDNRSLRYLPKGACSRGYFHPCSTKKSVYLVLRQIINPISRNYSRIYAVFFIVQFATSSFPTRCQLPPKEAEFTIS